MLILVQRKILVTIPAIHLHPETKMSFVLCVFQAPYESLISICFFCTALQLLKKNNRMNSNVMPAIVQIDRENLRQLVTEVKETLATDYRPENVLKHKSFGLTDLWKCRKSMRTATSLRRF